MDGSHSLTTGRLISERTQQCPRQVLYAQYGQHLYAEDHWFGVLLAQVTSLTPSS
jgi:hypothetical protein